MRRPLRTRTPAKPLTPEAARERALGTALRALARGPRSRSEIAAILARRGVGADRLDRQRATRLLHARGFPGDVVRQALGIDVDIDVADAADAGREDE